jgi:Ca2+-transporting ATPase
MPEQIYNVTIEKALQTLETSQAGITAGEAKKRLVQYGPNLLSVKKKTPPWLMFLNQFLSPLIYVLMVAVVVSMAVGEFIDGFVVFGVLILNAVIGFIQESNAEKAMEALMRIAAPHAKAKRDGVISVIPARHIVPGDIIQLETGDKVPADARLISETNLKVNESILTGESMPVPKNTGLLPGELPVSERKNMVFSGTIVTYGKAVAVVTLTGMNTEMGKIAASLQEVKEEKTPLQLSLDKLSRVLIIVFLAVCVLLVVVGLLQGIGWLEVFLLAVAAAVSAIPEGLPR